MLAWAALVGPAAAWAQGSPSVDVPAALPVSASAPVTSEGSATSVPAPATAASAAARSAPNPPASPGATELHVHASERSLLAGDEVHFHGAIDAWMERGEGATPKTVQALPAKAWRPAQANDIHPLQPGQTLWLRFTAPPSSDSTHWYAEIPFANLDRISLYAADGAGGWTAQHAGDLVAVSRWPVKHRVPLLRLSQQPDRATPHLLRIQHVNGTSVPVSFYSETQLVRKERNVSLMLGIYFGLMLLAAVLALGNGFFTRDLAFALFAGTLFITALTQASFTGVAGALLWPDHPWWNDMAPYALAALSAAFAVLFVWAVTSLTGRSRLIGRAMLVWSAVGLVVAGAVFAVPPELRVKLAGIYALIAMVACVAALFWVWRAARDRYAPWLLGGMLIAAFTATLHILRAFELLPTTFGTRNLMLAGVGAMCVVSLMVMLVRSRDRGMTALRMRGLHRIDPATGLAVPEVLMERLPRTIQRAVRLDQTLALLLIELTNGNALRRAIGRRADREVPVHLASRLLGVARDIDTVARIGDRQFAMLIEGPVSVETVEALTTRVVAACTRPLGPRETGPVPAVRLAWAHIPRDGSQARTLMDQLAMLLSTAPPDDPRTIFRLR